MRGLDDPALTEVLDVIGVIYEAATDARKWTCVGDAINRLLSASGCHIGYYDFEEEKLGFNIRAGFETMTPQLWQRLEKLLPEDPRMEVWQRLPGKPHICRDIVDEKTWHASRMYQEVFRPGGMDYSIGVKLEDESGSFTGIAIVRGPHLPPFSSEDSELVGLLIPHLRRSLLIFKRFAVLDLEKRSALEALDAVKTGIVLLRQGGVVVYANAYAREISEDNDGFQIWSQGLLIENQKVNREVVSAVDDVIQAACDNKKVPGQSFSIPRKSGASAYVGRVSVLWGNNLRFDLGALDVPVAVLFLTDLERPIEAPYEILMRGFGLTPTEAKVLECLVAGRTVRQTAEDLNISEHTVRQHLKVLFDKTGCHRQAELIRLVLSSPLWQSVHPA